MHQLIPHIARTANEGSAPLTNGGNAEASDVSDGGRMTDKRSHVAVTRGRKSRELRAKRDGATPSFPTS